MFVVYTSNNKKFKCFTSLLCINYEFKNKIELMLILRCVITNLSMKFED